MLCVVKELFLFGWIFVLVVLGLHMDWWLSIPQQTFEKIFVKNFPWNLIVFSAMIYIAFSILKFIRNKIFN